MEWQFQRCSEKPIGSLEKSLANAFAYGDFFFPWSCNRDILLIEQFMLNPLLSPGKLAFCFHGIFLSSFEGQGLKNL